MKKLKKPLLFTLCILPLAVVGAYLSVRMALASADASQLEPMIAQLGSREAVVLASCVQPVVYVLVSAFFGYILAEKLGLLRPLRFEKAKTLRVLWVSVLCGALLSLDAWTFARWIPELDYGAQGRFDAVTWLASILYGGVLEEVMLRWFVMSLLAFLIWRLLFRREAAVPAGALIAANVLAALLFAAEHLPATVQTFGGLTPLLLLRCFLLNGAAGLVFGRFYRKYGIHYAMLSHALFHIVSHTIWLLAF